MRVSGTWYKHSIENRFFVIITHGHSNLTIPTLTKAATSPRTISVVRDSWVMPSYGIPEFLLGDNSPQFFQYISYENAPLSRYRTTDEYGLLPSKERADGKVQQKNRDWTL